MRRFLQSYIMSLIPKVYQLDSLLIRELLSNIYLLECLLQGSHLSLILLLVFVAPTYLHYLRLGV
jgi:hypothetical protein